VNKSLSKSPGQEQKDTQEQYKDALRDFKIEWMSSGVLSAEQLQEDYADDVHFLIARLKLVCEKDCPYESAKPIVSQVFSKVCACTCTYGTREKKCNVPPEKSVVRAERAIPDPSAQYDSTTVFPFRLLWRSGSPSHSCCSAAASAFSACAFV
jgi:hypothetical protein